MFKCFIVTGRTKEGKSRFLKYMWKGQDVDYVQALTTAGYSDTPTFSTYREASEWIDLMLNRADNFLPALVAQKVTELVIEEIQIGIKDTILDGSKWAEFQEVNYFVATMIDGRFYVDNELSRLGHHHLLDPSLKDGAFFKSHVALYEKEDALPDTLSDQTRFVFRRHYNREDVCAIKLSLSRSVYINS